MEGSLIISAIGVVLGLIALMILAYKGATPILFTVIASIIVLVTGGLDVFDGLIKGFAVGTSTYFKNFLLLFVTGALFGRIYQDSLGATTIADKLAKLFGEKNPLIPLFLASIILSYAGVSGFILIFAIYPIALELFRRANWNKRIIPPAFAFAAWSVAQLAPGTTQVHNVIPMTFLGTGPMAGWEIGFPTSIVTCIAGYIYFSVVVKKLAAQGLVFDSYDEIKSLTAEGEAVKQPPFWAAIIPIIFVIVSFNGFGMRVEIAVTIGNLLAIALMWKQLPFSKWFATINEGIKSAISVLVNTAVVVGFGSVVMLSPFYKATLVSIQNMDMNPYVFVTVAQIILSGILGSSSSAINLVYQTLTPVFLKFGEMGYSLEFIHRISIQACGFIETLPHCGALLAAFTVCGLTHKECYKYVFWSTVIIPGVVIFVVMLPLALILG